MGLWGRAQTRLRAEWRRYLANTIILLLPLILMWILVIIDVFLPPTERLSKYGLHPRSFPDLFAILWSPFLHANVAHLLGNSSAYVTLGVGFLLSDKYLFECLFCTVGLIVLCGFAIWCVGRPHSNYVGFSGVLFGWFSDRLVAGWIMRHSSTDSTISASGWNFLRNSSWRAKVRAVLFGLMTLVSLGGSFWLSMFPSSGKSHIAWEAHLFGFIFGIFLSVAYHKLVVPFMDSRQNLALSVELDVFSREDISNLQTKPMADESFKVIDLEQNDLAPLTELEFPKEFDIDPLMATDEAIPFTAPATIENFSSDIADQFSLN